MTETPQRPPAGQPGVRYRKANVERPETTVIDGKPSTRMVKETVWVAVPPRDWDEVIRRGATTVAVLVTVLAALGTAASVGGLLSSRLLHPGVAYAVGAVFTASWLVCLGIEHIERVDADRAARARGAGWVMLLMGMGAVITYGHEKEQLAAGVVGSCLDLAAKGLWWLILGLDRVKLAPGVAHWVAEREQELAGRYLLGMRLRRLTRRSGQLQTGAEFQAAEAILAQARGHELPAAPVSGQEAGVSAPVSGQAPEPPAPARQAAPAAPEAAPPAAPVQPPASTPTPSAETSGQDPEPPAEQSEEPPTSTVLPMAPSIRQIVINAVADDPAISEEDLLVRVREVHGDRPKLPETVARYRRQALKQKAG
ncbi:hypothetical protein [Streptomyces sp. enrichment culture]|uniref:hypothetical protein n=1 Tax=Streptomyces sp. enrichment culture TaxID=1795815 RepID=UPI003F57C11A